MSMLEGRFTSSFENAALHVKKIMDFLEAEDAFVRNFQRTIVDFVLRELLNNAVEHGNQDDIRKHVSYQLHRQPDFVEICVTDQGHGFSLEEAIRADRSAGVDSVRNRGLLALHKLGWRLSVQGAAVTARYEYSGEQENKFMQITVENGVATCVAENELTVTSVQQMIEATRAVLDGRDDFQTVCVDLSKTQNIDSIGLTFLIGLYKTYSARGKKVKLMGYSSAILDIFKIMRFDELFEL